MNGYKVSIIILVGLAAGFAVFLFWPKPSPKIPDPNENVSVGIVGDSSALVLLAEHLGYFNKNGLDVQIVKYSVGARAMSDLLSNKIDLSVNSDFIGAVNSFTSNNFKILASIAKARAFEIIARSDHGIAVPGDLAGKKIGVTKGTAGEFWLGEFLISSGLVPEQVTVIDLPPNELTEAIISGEIDAVLNLEPHIYNAKRSLPGKTVSWYGRSGQGVYSLLTASSNMVSNRPAVMEKFVRSLVQAEEYFDENPDASLEFIGSYFGYTEEYLELVLAEKLSFEVALEQAMILTMEDEARWLISQNLTDQRVVPNFLNYIYFPALDSVRPDSVTIIK